MSGEGGVAERKAGPKKLVEFARRSGERGKKKRKE